MRLTDLGLQKLSVPKKGQKTYRDETLRGFGVRVSQGGGKSFVVMYGKRRKLTTLGKYPHLSLKDAREQARRLLVDGQDLKETELRPASAVSVKETLEAYLEECAHKNKPRTVACYTRFLNKYLPKGKLQAITRRQIMAEISKLARVPAEQSHAFTSIKIFFNWCLKNGYLETHPLLGVTGVGKIKPRERVLDECELSIIWNKAYSENTIMGNIVALCLLTGQRRGEIAQLKWEYIEESVIRLPAELTKNGREHLFPFGDLTKEIFERIPGGSEYLFPGRSGGVFNGWSKSKLEFDRPGVEPWWLHDLRRTFASNHARLGTPVHLIEKMLNHISGTFAGVAGVYNRYDYMDEMKLAVVCYEEKLRELLVGGAQS